MSLVKPLNMPQLGLGDGEVLVRDWLLEPGAEFSTGDPLVEVETDKAVMEVEAPFDGILVERLCSEGDEITPGRRIGFAAEPGTPLADARAELAAMPAPEEEPEPASESPHGDGVPPVGVPPGGLASAPQTAGRFLTVEHGELAGVPLDGGRHDRQPPAPSQAAPTPDPAELDDREAAGPGSERPLSRRRRAIARRMSAAVAIPTFTVSREIAADGLKDAVTAGREAGDRVTITDLLLRACGIAGRARPEANAWLLGETIIEFEDVNVALAVDAPEGVVAPVIKGVDKLEVPQISEVRADLVARAREGEAAAAELLGGTITLSNVAGLGAHGITPVLSAPQVVALGVGMARPQGEREVMDVCVVADHRVLDGADGARFLGALADAIDSLAAEPAS